MLSAISQFFTKLGNDLAQIDTGIILLAVIIVSTAIVLDAVTMFARKEKERVGLTSSSATISLDGSKLLPTKRYVSEIQGLAGTPDALILEDGYVIPLEHKPLARKMRDRYLAQLLVYMRLIEEFEGKRPPYGYLTLGPKHRKLRVANTIERQAWLQSMIDEMRGILAGEKDCLASPQEQKCRKCDVAEYCKSAFQKNDIKQSSSSGAAGYRKL